MKAASILSIASILLGYGNRHLYNVHVVQAWPDGSPACIVGGTGVRSMHLSNPNNVTGSIDFGSFVVTIGSKTLNSTTVNSIAANTNLELVLSSVNNTQFRGVLVVLNQPNASLLNNLLISPSTDYQVQGNCSASNYSGFTHTNSNLKTSAKATINLSVNQSAFLDVNVVVANNITISVFYYTRFQLIAVAPPTNAPTKSPTKAPAKAPTKAPSKAPTKAPSKAPTKAPTKKRPKPCGLFGLSILCFNGCGFFGRLLGLCKEYQ